MNYFLEMQKRLLGKTIVRMYHGTKQNNNLYQSYKKTKHNEMPVVEFTILGILIDLNILSSKSEARRIKE